MPPPPIPTMTLQDESESAASEVSEEEDEEKKKAAAQTGVLVRVSSTDLHRVEEEALKRHAKEIEETAKKTKIWEKRASKWVPRQSGEGGGGDSATSDSSSTEDSSVVPSEENLAGGWDLAQFDESCGNQADNVVHQVGRDPGEHRIVTRSTGKHVSEHPAGIPIESDGSRGRTVREEEDEPRARLHPRVEQIETDRSVEAARVAR